MTYTLYGDLRSGAFSVEAALAEAGVPYEFKRVSLEKNEQLEPAYLAVNPTGKMPALRLPGGEIVTESAGLLLTVADRHPEAGLIPPAGSAARAECYRWLAYMASEIYPMVEIVDYPERFAPKGEQAEALKMKARDRIRERFLVIEKAIAGPWLLASGFSVADIYAAMFSRWSMGREWRECEPSEGLRAGERAGGASQSRSGLEEALRERLKRKRPVQHRCTGRRISDGREFTPLRARCPSLRGRASALRPRTSRGECRNRRQTRPSHRAAESSASSRIP